jgi:Cdc6-like AAA superfamily ATPase
MTENTSSRYPEVREPDWNQLYTSVSTVFTPASPIVERALFAGRLHQISRVLDAINQSGLHAVLYGERGVGKTSLANILAEILNAQGAEVITSKVNCDATDDFASAWRKALAEVPCIEEATGTGFVPQTNETRQTLADRLPKKPKPHDVRVLLGSLPQTMVLVFDEFDRLKPRAVRPFTDLIKALSDYSVDATVVLVGVANTVDQLVKDHQSIERAIVQVHLPRMPPREIRAILETGAEKLGVRIDRPSTNHIMNLSQGLPHYAHLVGLHAIRAAVGRRSQIVQMQDAERGVKAAVQNAQQSTKNQYHLATTSSHRTAIFHQVLLACALAHKDPLSHFRASEVIKPLTKIMGRAYGIPAFARHLNEFCTEERGRVLERSGTERRRRYRFCNPLLEPYVIMDGLSRNLITKAALAELIAIEPGREAQGRGGGLAT